MRSERWGIFVVLVLAVVIAKGLIGAGTFLIDHFVLIFTGYWMTREIFREPPLYNERNLRMAFGFSVALASLALCWLSFLPLATGWLVVIFGAYAIGQFVRGGAVRLRPKRFWRILFVALGPLSIFGIWYGGIMTYWRFQSAEAVYLGLAPTWFIGMSDGNDFMWNGFLLPLLGERIVPLEMIPTSGAFTIWGILLWLSQPIAFGLAVLKGNADAYFVHKMTGTQRLQATLGMACVGIAVSCVVIAGTLLLVHLSK